MPAYLRLLWPSCLTFGRKHENLMTVKKLGRYAVADKLRIILAGLALLTPVAASAADAITQTSDPIWIQVTSSTGSDVQSLTVKPAVNGYILATATGTTNWAHTYGNQGNYCLTLDTAANSYGGCTPDTNSTSAIRAYVAAAVPTTVSGYGASDPYSIVKLVQVTKGTTYTFYLGAYETGFDSVYLFHPTITALFVPSALAQ
jgi:hypothetical protein